MEESSETSHDQPDIPSEQKKGNRLWGAIKAQLPKVFVFSIIIGILLVIMNLSSMITPNRDNLQADQIINFQQEQIIIMALASLLIIVVFTYFTRLIFGDQSEFEVAGKSFTRSFIFVVLIIAFLGCIFILLDTALINIYITLPLVTVVWWFNDLFAITSIIPSSTDLFSYADIRGNVFVVLFTLLMIVPVLMFVFILSRFGRRKLVEFKGTNLSMYIKLFEGWILLLLIAASGIIFFTLSQDPSQLVGIVFASIFFVVGGIVGYFLIVIVIELFRRVLHVTSSYFLMILPMIILFYGVPVLLWSLWDTIIVLVQGDFASTIYHDFPELYDASIEDNAISLMLKHLGINSTQWFRIIEIDFVIIIGISAIVIGFAEGYSLYSIMFGLFKGQALTKSGKYFTGSSSAGAVRISRTFFLFAWGSLVWDKALEILQFIEKSLQVNFPFDIDLPKIFELISLFTLDISFDQLFLPLTILLIPAVIIVNSSFKFLSVGLVIERTKDDIQMFFLFISSTFILIVSKIYADISSAEIFADPTFQPLLPFYTLSETNFIPFAVNVFSNLEAFAFYIGLIVVLFRTITGKMRSEPNEVQNITEVASVDR